MNAREITILNVDDDEAKRYTVSRILKREGFLVHEATSGEEALRNVEIQRPNLIVLDVNMPDMSGLEVCRRLKANPQTASIPVLHLSATYVRSENKAQGLDAGADGYLAQEVEPAELLATIRAILRIKEAEDKAQTLASQWQATFDAISDGICLLDAARTVVRCNAAFADLLRRPAEAILGSRYCDLLAGVFGAAEAPALDAMFAQQRRQVVERQARDGWLRITADPVCQTPGTLAGAVCIFSDISERKAVEELRHSLLVRARERTAQLQELAAIATRLALAHDLESVLRLVTEEARRLIPAHQSISSLTVDTSRSQAISTASFSDKYAAWRGYDIRPDGSGIYSLVCQTNRPLRMTQVELETHPAWKALNEEADKNPPLRGWLAAPFVTRDGRNLGLLQLSDKIDGDFGEDDEAILVQLAQMASAALENARLVEELRQTDRSKDEFLATLAHELRNTLAPIRNSLNILRLAAGQGPAAQRVHDMMERQVSHMVRLVDDLMEVSRITRGKIDLRKERMELAAVVRSAVETSKPLLDAGRHQLAISLPAEPLILNVDPVRMAQILGNLLNNAAKYMDDGGQVWLSARREGNEAVISVRDAGVGISAEMLPRVFEMFTQIDRTMARAQGGLGIGLTLVRSLVQMHGGRVEARSDGPGRGSEFIVRLPVASAQGSIETALREGSQPDAGLAPRRILVVDDNRDSADSLGMLLEFLGARAQVVYDGPAALEAIHTYRPAVVLLDIGMPGMDGYEVARRVRREPEFGGIVLVALTGWGQEEDRLHSKTAGFDHHLVKPVAPDVLQALLVSLEQAPCAP